MFYYIDLFAGAGGLSEGFTANGYNAVAHVEMNQDACFTLKTRICYYYFKKNNKIDIYQKYLNKEISRACKKIRKSSDKKYGKRI